MKNSISFSCLTPVVSVLALALALPAHGGGTLNFANNTSNRIINAHSGAPITAAENLVAGLYWSPLASNIFVKLGAPVPVGIPRDGIFVGGTRTTGAETSGGASGKFQVRVWSGEFPTYEEALLQPGGLTGQSFVFVNPTGNSAGAPPAPPESLLAGGFAGFAVSSNGLVQPPLLSALADKVIDCGSAWSFDVPSAIDGCTDANVVATVLATTTNGNCPTVITRIWSVNNVCNGDFATSTQIVTVVDTVAPEISCAGNKTVACGQAWEFDAPTTMDACSSSGLAILSTITNSLCPLSVTRTWNAWDSCGNTNTCSQTITGAPVPPLTLTGLTNKMVFCTNDWAFDVPFAGDDCGGTLLVEELGTVTNSLCPLSLTRAWRATNECHPAGVTSHQTVTVLCPSCPVLQLAKGCPAYPVPPGGTLAWFGSVTNVSDITISNVVVSSDQPAPGTVVFGPITLAPGEGVGFGGSHPVPGVSGPYVGTLTAMGTGPNDLIFMGTATASCAGTNHVTPGDMNGDGVVSQAELNAVLANYWPHSPWLNMTNAALLSDGRFQFELTNAGAWNFTVLVSTNATDWTSLPAPAFPVYQFIDPEGTNAPQRLYRLQWP